jgi:hypothetical protein
VLASQGAISRWIAVAAATIAIAASIDFTRFGLPRGDVWQLPPVKVDPDQLAMEARGLHYNVLSMPSKQV